MHSKRLVAGAALALATGLVLVCFYFCHTGTSTPPESTDRARTPSESIGRARTPASPLSAKTLNRVFTAPEGDSAFAESFAATQTPTARGTAPYVLIPRDEIAESHYDLLKEMNIAVKGYFPPNGILVEMTEADLAAVRERADIFAFAGEWEARDKVSPSLAASVNDHEATDNLRVSIDTFSHDDLIPVAKMVESLGGKINSLSRDGNGFVHATLPRDAALLAKIAAHGEVHWIGIHGRMRVSNNDAVQSSCLNVTPVWNPHGLTGRGQVVAVYDTGLDTGNPATVHSDFKDGNGNTRIRGIVNVSGYSSETKDCNGHGTHVTGSIIGNGANSGGQYRSVAYEAEAFIMSGDGFQDGTRDLFDKGIWDQDTYFFTSFVGLYTKYIDQYEYRVHNNSLGSDDDPGVYEYNALSADIAAMQKPELLITAAAGNGNGAKCDEPATAKNVLTVGSCSKTSPTTRSPFSNYGTKDGRFKPDLMSIGEDIVSTRSSEEKANDFNPYVSSYYAIASGTSMATPLASGCALLVRQWLNEEKNIDEPSSALIKAILTGGASASRPTTTNGWGTINLEKSLFPSGGSVIVKDRFATTSAGRNEVCSFWVTNSTPTLKVQLAWIDPVATTGASSALVHDHDLIVVNVATGTEYLGNDFDNTGDEDNKNNIEGVRIALPAIGQYKVYVTEQTTSGGMTSFPALYIAGGVTETEPSETPDDPVEPDTPPAPTYRYEFNGNLNSSGTVALTLGDSEKAVDYEASRNGQAMKTVNNAGHPWGSGMTLGDDWLIATSIKSIATENALLFSVGNIASYGFALISGGEGRVLFTTRNGREHYQTLITANVPTATTQYHLYTIRYKDGYVTLAVDGVEVDPVQMAKATDGSFQWGGLHGGVESATTGYERDSGVCIDEFRMYHNLTVDAEFLSSLAEEMPVWPLPKGPATANITGDVTWSTKEGTADWSDDWGNDSARDLTLTNEAESCTFTLDAALTAQTVKIVGAGTLEFTGDGTVSAALDLSEFTGTLVIDRLASRWTTITTGPETTIDLATHGFVDDTLAQSLTLTAGTTIRLAKGAEAQSHYWINKLVLPSACLDGVQISIDMTLEERSLDGAWHQAFYMIGDHSADVASIGSNMDVSGVSRWVFDEPLYNNKNNRTYFYIYSEAVRPVWPERWNKGTATDDAMLARFEAWKNEHGVTDFNATGVESAFLLGIAPTGAEPTLSVASITINTNVVSITTEPPLANVNGRVYLLEGDTPALMTETNDVSVVEGSAPIQVGVGEAERFYKIKVGY